MTQNPFKNDALTSKFIGEPLKFEIPKNAEIKKAFVKIKSRMFKNEEVCAACIQIFKQTS